MDTSGSWTLPDEYLMLRDTVRRFVERDVRESVAAFNAKRSAQFKGE